MDEKKIKSSRWKNLRLVSSIMRDVEKLPMIVKETDFAMGTVWVNKQHLLEILRGYK